MKVIDVFSSLKPKPLTKISFSELDPTRAEGRRREPPARRRSFRGSELPRLSSWSPSCWPAGRCSSSSPGPRRHDKPAPPPLPAAEIQPVVPDDGVEFQALIDKTPIQLRESAAYANLLRRARETPPGRARRRGPPRHPLHPSLGAPQALPGRAGPPRGDRQEGPDATRSTPSCAPRGGSSRPGSTPTRTGRSPTSLIFEDPPAGLPIGHDLFTSGDLRRLLHEAPGLPGGRHPPGGPDARRPAPLTRTPRPAPAPMVELRNFSRRDGFVIVFVLLFAYLAVRDPSRSAGPWPSRDRPTVPGRARRRRATSPPPPLDHRLNDPVPD